MKQFKLISADLFCENVGTPQQIQSMIDEAWEHKTRTPYELAFSNDGCWRSEFKYKNIDWLMDEIFKLVEKAMDYYETADPLFSSKRKHYGEPEVNYWSNINDPGSHNALHCHSLHHFVACYYLQATGTGDIVFHNPANLTESCHAQAPFVSRMAFSPKEGDLLVWPAWMPHETVINKSKHHRINVAFNIRFKTPRIIYNENY